MIIMAPLSVNFTKLVQWTELIGCKGFAEITNQKIVNIRLHYFRCLEVHPVFMKVNSYIELIHCTYRSNRSIILVPRPQYH